MQHCYSSSPPTPPETFLHLTVGHQHAIVSQALSKLLGDDNPQTDVPSFHDSLHSQIILDSSLPDTTPLANKLLNSVDSIA